MKHKEYFIKSKYGSGYLSKVDNQPAWYTGVYEEIVPSMGTYEQLKENRPNGVTAKFKEIPVRLSKIKKGERIRLADEITAKRIK